MPDMETLLAEAFGFAQFEHIEELQRQIDDTLERYADSDLSMDELADAAGGIADKDRPPERLEKNFSISNRRAGRFGKERGESHDGRSERIRERNGKNNDS